MPVSMVVLVVEDEILTQGLLEIALAEAGYEVCVVCSGAEAMSFLDACSECPRALVTDVNLGSAPNGWAIGRRARELSFVMPVVYMTGDSGHEWRAEGVADSLMVLKPFEPAQVVAAVSSLLAECSRPQRRRDASRTEI
jgi:DNA-binding response OmpR family regulator